MRAVDTNVLLRHFVQDDPVQSPIATRFLTKKLTTESPGFVSVAVLCELIWTLKESYRADNERIAQAIGNLLQARQIRVAEEPAIAAALRSRAQLVDAVIHELGRAAGCSETVTFDRRFARTAGVRLLSG